LCNPKGRTQIDGTGLGAFAASELDKVREDFIKRRLTVFRIKCWEEYSDL